MKQIDLFKRDPATPAHVKLVSEAMDSRVNQLSKNCVQTISGKISRKWKLTMSRDLPPLLEKELQLSSYRLKSNFWRNSFFSPARRLKVNFLKPVKNYEKAQSYEVHWFCRASKNSLRRQLFEILRQGYDWYFSRWSKQQENGWSVNVQGPGKTGLLPQRRIWKFGHVSCSHSIQQKCKIFNHSQNWLYNSVKKRYWWPVLGIWLVSQSYK